jgi:hypothetical protein
VTETTDRPLGGDEVPAATPAREQLGWPIRCVLVLFVLFGAAAVYAGGHDGLLAADLQARFTGWLLCFGGVVMLSAVASILARGARKLALGLAACMIGMLICVLLIVTQLISRNASGLLAVWIALLVACGLAARALWAGTSPGGRELGVRTFPVIFSVVSVATLFSIGQFVYTMIYVPASATPSVSVAVQLTRIGVRRDPQGDRLLLGGTIVLHNTSGMRVNPVGSAFFAYGQRLRPSAARSERLVQAIRRADANPGLVVQRYASLDDGTLLEHGRLLQDTAYLEAGEEDTFPIELAIPRGRFDIVTVFVLLGCARPALHLPDVPARAWREQDGSVVSEMSIEDNSVLRTLTRGDRYLRIEYGASDGTAPLLEVHVTRHEHRVDTQAYDDVMRHQYGIAYATAEGSVALAGRDGSGG